MNRALQLQDRVANLYIYLICDFCQALIRRIHADRVWTRRWKTPSNFRANE